MIFSKKHWWTLVNVKQKLKHWWTLVNITNDYNSLRRERVIVQQQHSSSSLLQSSGDYALVIELQRNVLVWCLQSNIGIIAIPHGAHTLTIWGKAPVHEVIEVWFTSCSSLFLDLFTLFFNKIKLTSVIPKNILFLVCSFSCK